jgi:hypothetical protein
LFQRRAVAHIRAEAQGLASAAFDLGRCFVDVFLAARGGDDIGSGICEAEAQVRPIPEVPPITTAVLPSRLKMLVVIVS